MGPLHRGREIYEGMDPGGSKEEKAELSECSLYYKS